MLASRNAELAAVVKLGIKIRESVKVLRYAHKEKFTTQVKNNALPNLLILILYVLLIDPTGMKKHFLVMLA